MSRRRDGRRLLIEVSLDEFSIANQRLLEPRLPGPALAVELVVRYVGIVVGSAAGDVNITIGARKNFGLHGSHERGATGSTLVSRGRGNQGVTEGVSRDLEPGGHDEYGAAGSDDLVLRCGQRSQRVIDVGES